MSKHDDKPLNFNRAMFGSMGSNPSINALTNANAMAAQQMPQMPQMPQQPPVTPAVGVYGRPDMRAQMMGVGSSVSPFGKHADEEVRKLNKNIKAAQKRLEKYGGGENSDPEVKFDVEQEIKAYRNRIAAIEEEHKNK
jgi:hypothetical protein